METNVQLIDLSRPGYDSILLTLQTTGGSGMAPGAITAFSPIGPFVLSNTLINAGGSLGGALGSGISIDRCRTAREIVAAISQYCVQEHLISKKNGLHPKQLGKLPYFLCRIKKYFQSTSNSLTRYELIHSNSSIKKDNPLINKFSSTNYIIQ